MIDDDGLIIKNIVFDLGKKELDFINLILFLFFFLYLYYEI